jgi:hypothetical protein
MAPPNSNTMRTLQLGVGLNAIRPKTGLTLPILTNRVVHYEADFGVTTVLDTGVLRVDSWADQSPNSFHAVAFSATGRPFWEDNVWNGIGGVKWTASQLLYHTQATVYGNPKTVFVVAKSALNDVPRYIFDGNNSGNRLIYGINGGSQYLLYNYNVASTFKDYVHSPADAAFIGSFVSNGANSYARANGIDLVAPGATNIFTVGTGTFLPITIGSRRVSVPASYWRGHIGAIVIYSGLTFTAQMIADTEGYFSDKYGIAI